MHGTQHHSSRACTHERSRQKYLFFYTQEIPHRAHKHTVVCCPSQWPSAAGQLRRSNNWALHLPTCLSRSPPVHQCCLTASHAPLSLPHFLSLLYLLYVWLTLPSISPVIKPSDLPIAMCVLCETACENLSLLTFVRSVNVWKRGRGGHCGTPECQCACACVFVYNERGKKIHQATA